ncbi:MAG: WYL domain-containing protein [Sedimenticola sp.]
MASRRLGDISQGQQERLSHIDFRLHFLGTIGRNDLVRRFGIKAAAATRDITLYKELASQNLEYNTKAKIYSRSEPFTPLFDYSSHQALTALVHGFGDDFVVAHKAHIACETPAQLNKPQLNTLSVLTRAIHQKKPVEITYRSLSSGKTVRKIVPFILVDNGLRWHVRAFDRRRSRFTDFVINRISDPRLVGESKVEEEEQKDSDIQWNRIVELEIVPHPRLRFPETIKQEYDMTDGTLYVNVRAAVAGYVLRRWNVDCSEDHGLDGPEYHLWLKNRQALYGVENLVIAPGYNKDGKV